MIVIALRFANASLFWIQNNVPSIHFSPMSIQIDADVYHTILYAYQEAVRGKKDTLAVDRFRIHEEKNLIELYRQLTTWEYKPWKATFFIIHDPVQREICAAPFEDRIVHHIIYQYLSRIFDPCFIADSYGSRIWKGTHYGIQKTLHHMRQCTHNKTEKCWLMKLDIQWFFMSIDTCILTNQIYKKFTTYNHKPWGYPNTLPIGLWQRIQSVINHRPTDNFCIKGHKKDWHGLPKSKSLFSTLPWKWLPLGNLTSQLFANIYLHDLDIFIKHTLKITYYGRYMDDMVLMHQDKEVLLNAKEQIQHFLKNKLHITLHPKKQYLQLSDKWVPFLGYHIYPRWYRLGKRTIKKRRSKLHVRNISKKTDPTKVQSTYNSYLWMARHGHNYHLRKQMIRKMKPHLSNKLNSSGWYKKLVLRTRTISKKRWYS
jgi:RNA-directed DNA polymerase